MSDFIRPTVGRIVHCYPSHAHPGDHPRAAIVTGEGSGYSRIHLTVFAKAEQPYPAVADYYDGTEPQDWPTWRWPPRG